MQWVVLSLVAAPVAWWVLYVGHELWAGLVSLLRAETARAEAQHELLMTQIEGIRTEELKDLRQPTGDALTYFGNVRN